MFGRIRRPSLGDDAPGRNNEDAIADAEQFLEIRNRHNNRGASGRQRGDRAVNVGLGSDVDASGRFVQEDDAPIRSHGSGKRNFLRISPAKVPYRDVGVLRDDGERGDNLVGPQFLLARDGKHSHRTDRRGVGQAGIPADRTR